MDIEECVRSIEDKVSKDQCSCEKMCFCIQHKRFYCKDMCHARFNEIDVNVLEDSSSHDHSLMLEECKVRPLNHVKERACSTLEANESIAPNLSHVKLQAEEMNSTAISRKLVKNNLINLRKNRNKDATLLKNSTAGNDE